jgi:ADP-heptose:LPS heptosyltransferase
VISFLEFLRRLRVWVAPSGSLREKLARFVYVPLINRVPARKRMYLLHGGKITPEIVYLADMAVKNCRRQPIRTIVVLKLDHIGDLIIGMRALRTLREGFTDAHITLVCASWNQELAQGLGLFDRVVCFDFFTPMNRDWSGTSIALRSLYDCIAALPLGTYDLAVDLRHDPDTRPCLFRIRSTYRAGFYAPTEADLPYLDLMLPVSEGILIGEGGPRSLHADLRLQVLASAVVAAFGVQPAHPALALAIKKPSTPTRRFAVLAIGAGDPIRCWPIERYGELGRALIARYGLDIVVLGGTADEAAAMRLAALLPLERVRTVLGMRLADLPPLLAQAQLCVCNGSGMSHLAAALGVPTVGILGGTTRMDVWHPAGPNALSVGGRTLCQPCGYRQASECPWDVACLTAVETPHVLSACERLLGDAQGLPNRMRPCGF